MAQYRDSSFLTHRDDYIFSQSWHPGDIVKYSGIYRCKNCGHEITSIQDHIFPTERHHVCCSPIIWQLIVTTNNYKI